MHVHAQIQTPRQTPSAPPLPPRPDGQSGSSRPHAAREPQARPPESRCTNSFADSPASASSNFSTTTASMPVSASSRTRSSIGVSSFGAVAGRRYCSGCGSNVTATALTRCPLAQFTRLVHHRLQNLPMPQMHAVEVPDRRYRRTKPRRNLRDPTIDGNHARSATLAKSPDHRLTANSSPS